MKMDPKNGKSLPDRLLRWFLKLVLNGIPAAWTVWVIHLACRLNAEIAQMGEAEWTTLIELAIVVFFNLGFIKGYMKHDLDD